MLREQKILLYLEEHINENYISANELAGFLKVSDRTIKSDINKLRGIMEGINGLYIESIASKGYKLIIENHEDFENLMSNFDRKTSNDLLLNSQDSRVKTLLRILLNSTKGVNKVALANNLSVSESTLYRDIKEAKILLKRYGLILEYDFLYGVKITGDEINKRRCIINEGIIDYDLKLDDYFSEIDRIKDVFIEIFNEYKYKMNESLFQNLIIHFMLVLNRIEKGYILHDNHTNKNFGSIEYNISQSIFKKFARSMSKLDAEIEYFAINLTGKREYDFNSEIPLEISKFMTFAFIKIKEEYKIDFTNLINLEAAMSYHFLPFLTRVQNQMQLKNEMLTEIKQAFPFAFDLASFFSTLVREKFYYEMSEDEISYFTLYFNYGLENLPYDDNGRTILIVTIHRQSELLLLKQKLLSWFKKQIKKIDIINPTNVRNVNLEDYTAIFMTENIKELKNIATRVSIFPTDNDFHKMEVAINGYDTMESVITNFSEDLFIVMNAKNKEEVVKALIKISSKHMNLPSKFEESVMERERLSSTYLSNGIALPHPLQPLTEDTFVSVCVLKKPVLWDEKQEVNLVMLISVKIGSPKAYKLWSCLTEFISNKVYINQVLTDKSYEKFIEELKKSLIGIL